MKKLIKQAQVCNLFNKGIILSMISNYHSFKNYLLFHDLPKHTKKHLTQRPSHSKVYYSKACSWNQKTKPPILQFTNLNCWKVSFKFVSSAFEFVCFEISMHYFLKFQSKQTQKQTKQTIVFASLTVRDYFGMQTFLLEP